MWVLFCIFTNFIKRWILKPLKYYPSSLGRFVIWILIFLVNNLFYILQILEFNLKEAKDQKKSILSSFITRFFYIIKERIFVFEHVRQRSKLIRNVQAFFVGVNMGLQKIDGGNLMYFENFEGVKMKDFKVWGR